MVLRPQFTVRDATLDDAAQLISLWAKCVSASVEEGLEAFSYQALWREPSESEARGALEFNALNRSRRILVAVHDETVVGAVVADICTLTPISGSRVLMVSDVQVDPNFRRRSVVSTLLATMAAYGEDLGCDITVATVSAHAKAPNRYLTKIGFNQVAVVRAITTAKLRARLAMDIGEAGRLVAMRRTLRRRQATTGSLG